MTHGKFTMIENPVPWPNGARCAAAFTWDMDADSILHLAHPDDADTRVSAMTDLRYGPEIAVPRICRMFESYDIKLSFFVPAWCIEEHPGAVDRMMEGGHEIAHHGFMHELQNTFTKERERYWFERSFSDKEVLAGDFINEINKTYKAIRPFFDYMSDVLTTDLNGEPIVRR